eukprot:472599_1
MQPTEIELKEQQISNITCAHIPQLSRYQFLNHEQMTIQYLFLTLSSYSIMCSDKAWEHLKIKPFSQLQHKSDYVQQIMKVESALHLDESIFHLPHDTQMEITKQNIFNLEQDLMNKEYTIHFKLPCYYYVTKVLKLLSLLIYNVAAVILSTTPWLKESNKHQKMIGVFMCLLVYTYILYPHNMFCCELSDAFLSKWIIFWEIVICMCLVAFADASPISLSIYIPLLILQVICEISMETMKDKYNNSDTWLLKETYRTFNDNTKTKNIKNELKSIKKELIAVKVILFLILGKMWLSSTDSRSPFYSIYFFCYSAHLIWEQNVNFELIGWIHKYGNYFNPQIFLHHNFITFYVLFIRISIGIWHLWTLILCIIYVSDSTKYDMSDYELGLTIFIMTWVGIESLCYPFCVVQLIRGSNNRFRLESD